MYKCWPGGIYRNPKSWSRLSASADSDGSRRTCITHHLLKVGGVESGTVLMHSGYDFARMRYISAFIVVSDSLLFLRRGVEETADEVISSISREVN
jgi:hypothetical protein